MLLPPIGIMGVMQYYKSGYVDFKVAAILCVAFLAGSYMGAALAVKLNDNILKKVFGVFLLALSMKYLFFSKK
jgi:hypothetical protein